MKEVKATVNGTEINVLTFSPEEIDRIHREIDEHRRAEQEARKLKNRVRNFIKNAYNAIRRFRKRITRT